MNKYILLDMSNMLHRTFFAYTNEDVVTQAGLAHHMALSTMNKFYRELRPVTKIVAVFDRPSWRKDYTRSELCVSGRVYKGERRKNMTPKQQEKYKAFLDHIKDFENILKEHTSVVCLSADKLEADDLIAGFAQQFGDDNEVVVVSTDNDFLQLLRQPNVKIVDPRTRKKRDLKEWDDDAEYFIFEKLFRGERGPSSDNVESAYPKLRSTKIKEAYHDPYKLEGLKHETWTNQDGKVMVVGDLLEENKMLMDLREQPPVIRQLIEKTINNGMDNPGNFSHFHFLKFCGKYDLKKVAEHIDNFVPMLSK